MNSLHIKKTRSARGKKAKSLANEMNNEGDNLNGSVEGVESGEFSRMEQFFRQRTATS
jgi:hypothetical protein